MLVEPGERALVCGGPGIAEALTERGVEAVDVGSGDALPAARDVDAVLVGWDRRFDYERLRRASDAAREALGWWGRTTTRTHPTPDGQIPGGGSLLAAVACASGRTPLVAGKPHEPAAELVRRRSAEIGTGAHGDGASGAGRGGAGTVGDIAVRRLPSYRRRARTPSRLEVRGRAERRHAGGSRTEPGTGPRGPRSRHAR